jgi:Ca3427-like PBP
LTNIIIGGVPEHFNLPWHLLRESGAAGSGTTFDWVDYPDGTGAMARDLDRGELDAAVLLTEGAAAGIAKGGRFDVECLFTESPLIWGVHVPARSELFDVAQLAEARFAISRFGSGSHLMSFALADSRGWPTSTLRFEVVGTLAGAIESFDADASDVFLWEKFMTQPVVDRGAFRRIGEFQAPWPAFVVAVGPTGAVHRAAIRDVVGQVLAVANELGVSPEAPALIAERYELDVRNVPAWLATTRWASSVRSADEALAAARDVLEKSGALS